jgi:hypothetical protein
VWTYVVLSGSYNGHGAGATEYAISTSNGIGTLETTALATDTALLAIKATLNGRAVPSVQLPVQKVRAAPPATGTGGGGSGATDAPQQTSGFTAINSTSFATISQTLTFTLPSGKTSLRCVVDLSCKFPKLSDNDGPWDVEFNVLRGGVAQGTTQHSNPDPYITDVEVDETNGGFLRVSSPGTMQYTLDMGSLTAGVQYSVTVQARIASGTIPTGKTMSFTGSITLSATP